VEQDPTRSRDVPRELWVNAWIKWLGEYLENPGAVCTNRSTLLAQPFVKLCSSNIDRSWGLNDNTIYLNVVYLYDCAIAVAVVACPKEGYCKIDRSLPSINLLARAPILSYSSAHPTHLSSVFLTVANAFNLPISTSDIACLTDSYGFCSRICSSENHAPCSP
jgi:hypothetical protein